MASGGLFRPGSSMSPSPGVVSDTASVTADPGPTPALAGGHGSFPTLRGSEEEDVQQTPAQPRGTETRFPHMKRFCRGENTSSNGETGPAWDAGPWTLPPRPLPALHPPPLLSPRRCQPARAVQGGSSRTPPGPWPRVGSLTWPCSPARTDECLPRAQLCLPHQL